MDYLSTVCVLPFYTTEKESLYIINWACGEEESSKNYSKIKQEIL